MQVALRRSPAALLVAGVLFFAGASPAWAAVAFNVAPSVPAVLTVGQTAPATLTIVNQSTGADGALGVAVNTITLVPSCGAPGIGLGNCPIASRDPGVLALSAVSGRAGTACADRTWTPAVGDMAQGKYAFVPSAQVVLGPANDGGAAATCVLDFTVEVLRSPAMDAALAAGVQTNQIGFASGQNVLNNAGTGIGNGQTTIARRPVTISAQAAPAAVTLGSPIHATATIAPAATNPTGTITFSLFGPDDAACAGTPVFVSAKPVAGGGATSDDFTPAAAGTYRFQASYNGDAVHANAGPTACDEPGAAASVAGNGAPPVPGPETPAPGTSTSTGTGTGAPLATPPPATAGAQTAAPALLGVTFTASPKTVRVSRTGSFSYAFAASPGNGKVGLKSSKRVKIGAKTQFMQLAAKTFAPSATGAVTVKFKLSSASLKALKRLKQLKFAVTAVRGASSFKTTVTLLAPKKT